MPGITTQPRPIRLEPLSGYKAVGEAARIEGRTAVSRLVLLLELAALTVLVILALFFSH